MTTQAETIQTEEVTSLPPPQGADRPASPTPKRGKPQPPPPAEASSSSPAKGLEREVVTVSETASVTNVEDAAKVQIEHQRDTKQKQLTGLSPVLQKLRNEKDSEAYAWINQVAGETEVNIAVIRKEPEWFTDPNTGQKKKTDGQVKVYSKWFTEQDIQNNHGGGRYQYVVRVKNQRGQWEFFGSRTVEIAGDPVLDDVPRQNATPQQQVAPAAAPIDPTAGKAMDAMIGILGKQLERPQHYPQPQGPSASDIAALINQATAPLIAQINTLTSQIVAKDDALVAARTAPPDPFRDEMMRTLMSGENGRITAIRTQHESEVRMLKEAAIENEKRLRDQFQRDLDRLERAHERELHSTKLAHDATSAANKSTIDVQKTVLDTELARLRAENSELRAEIKDLRSIKNPSIKDKVDELNTIKELVGGDEEEKGAIGTILEVLGNLPVVAKMADKLTGPGEQAAQVQQQQKVIAKPKMVRDRATGEIFKVNPDGSREPQKRKGTEVTNETGQTVEIPAIDPEMLKMAISFMETAFRNSTDPQMFAESARPQVGPSILAAISSLGVTEFFVKVAKVPATSPLMTQGGRNWSKKVAAFLLQGGGTQPELPAGDPPSGVP